MTNGPPAALAAGGPFDLDIGRECAFPVFCESRIIGLGRWMPRAASVSFVCMRYAGAQVSPKGIRQRVDEIAERLGPGGDTCVRKVFEKHMGESPLP